MAWIYSNSFSIHRNPLLIIWSSSSMLFAYVWLAVRSSDGPTSLNLPNTFSNWALNFWKKKNKFRERQEKHTHSINNTSAIFSSLMSSVDGWIGSFELDSAAFFSSLRNLNCNQIKIENNTDRKRIACYANHSSYFFVEESLLSPPFLFGIVPTYSFI